MKRFLLSFLTLLALHTSFSQVQFGLKTGLNLASIQDKDRDNIRARAGLHVGVLSQINLAEKFLLRPELQFSAKGYRSPAAGQNNEAVLRLNYVTLPVLFGYRPAENLAVLLGPEFGYLMGAQSKVSGRSTDVSYTYRNLDAGFDIGLVYAFSKSMGLDVRYNYGFRGLTNIVYTDANGNITGQRKADANRVLQIGLNYFFPG